MARLSLGGGVQVKLGGYRSPYFTVIAVPVAGVKGRERRPIKVVLYVTVARAPFDSKELVLWCRTCDLLLKRPGMTWSLFVKLNKITMTSQCCCMH